MPPSVRKINLKTSKCPLAHFPTFPLSHFPTFPLSPCLLIFFCGSLGMKPEECAGRGQTRESAPT